MRLKRTLPPLLFATLVGAGLARAQGTQEVRFLDGGKPARGVQISQFVNGQKTVLATTDAAGELIPVDALGLGKGADEALTIPIDALGFGKGEEVAVWVKRCADGTVVEVILTPANEDNPCPPEEGAEAGQRCGCERPIGFFIWGGGPVDIDVTDRTVTQDLDISMRPRIGETFAVGVKFNLSNMLQLEDVAGDAPGATASEATQWAPGIALLFEMTPFGPVAVGIAGTYSTMETKTTFGNQVQTGDINYYSLGPYARVDLGRGFRTGMRLVPFLEASWAYAWNRADFSVDGASEHRVQEGGRGEFGGGIYHYSTPNWGFIFQVLYSTSGEDGDADEHVRVGGGILWRPFGRVIAE